MKNTSSGIASFGVSFFLTSGLISTFAPHLLIAMESYPVISFDNTEFAFEYKSDKQLKKARFLFSLMGQPWLVKVGTRLTPWSIKAGLPVKGLIRNTIFSQFVGGETLDETAEVARNLGGYHVQVILDYGVEGGDDGEKGFDHSTEEFIRVINYAATQPNIPFMSVKVTVLPGLACWKSWMP